MERESVKRIEKEASFTANGHEYYIDTTLSISRFEEYEKLSVWFAFGMEYDALFKNIKEAYGLLNESRPMDAGIVLHNIMNGILVKSEKKQLPILLLCALFINRKDEDVKVYDKALMNEKIEDWKKEGLVMEDFFALASSLVGGYLESYNQVLATISPKTKRNQIEKNTR